MELTIASSNRNKINRMRKILKDISPSTIIDDISALPMLLPKETGKSERENLLIKLNYYFDALHKNIICEDDGIEVIVNNECQNVSELIATFNAKKEPFSLWKAYFARKSITSGRLIKYFGIQSSLGSSVEKVEIPITITYSDVKYAREELNILNNFIVPVDGDKVFADMMDEDRSKYIGRFITPVIGRLMRKMGYVVNQ